MSSSHLSGHVLSTAAACCTSRMSLREVQKNVVGGGAVIHARIRTGRRAAIGADGVSG